MLTKNDALANRNLDCCYNGGAGGVQSIALLDGGTSRFYAVGTKPSNPNAAPPSTAIATVVHAADSSSAASSRTVNMIGTMEDVAADNAGQIGWVRSSDVTGTMWHDQTCGKAGATTPITATALVGGLVQITANGHGLVNGQQVEVAGNAATLINGKWQVFNATLNTFQILSTDAPGVGGTVRLTFDVTIDNDVLVKDQKFTVQSMSVTDPI
jgi:hypothetical protein